MNEKDYDTRSAFITGPDERERRQLFMPLESLKP
jgi:hypothetical protein